jgi:hypothetical protein
MIRPRVIYDSSNLRSLFRCRITLPSLSTAKSTSPEGDRVPPTRGQGGKSLKSGEPERGLQSNQPGETKNGQGIAQRSKECPPKEPKEYR